MPCQFSGVWDEGIQVCPRKHMAHRVNVARERRAVEQCRRKVRAGGLHGLKRCPVPREPADPRQ